MARRRISGLPAVALGTALLVAWDLLLDPAMSKVTSYWIWGETGSYYGMPWSNLFGWGVTGLVLFLMLNRIAPAPRTKLGFALTVYFVNFALPLGFCMLNGYWVAVAAGIGAALAAIILAGAWDRGYRERRLELSRDGEAAGSVHQRS
jgi:putative membrane protein